MPWKTDDEGNVVIDNGNPVLVHADGKETSVDGDQLFGKVTELNTESANRRRQLKDAELKLKHFDGIEDLGEFVVNANKAMDTVKNLSDKKLVDAGEVERIKTETAKGFQIKLEASDDRAAKAEKALDRHVIGGSFARSKFISDALTIPSDMVESRFGSSFAVQDGKLVATDANGNEIYSRENPGQLAEFDEALEAIVGAYPYKDDILKSTIKPGSGGDPGAKRTVADGGKVISNDNESFISNLEGIASGKVQVVNDQ